MLPAKTKVGTPMPPQLSRASLPAPPGQTFLRLLRVDRAPSVRQSAVMRVGRFGRYKGGQPPKRPNGNIPSLSAATPAKPACAEIVAAPGPNSRLTAEAWVGVFSV